MFFFSLFSQGKNAIRCTSMSEPSFTLTLIFKSMSDEDDDVDDSLKGMSCPAFHDAMFEGRQQDINMNVSDYIAKAEGCTIDTRWPHNGMAQNDTDIDTKYLEASDNPSYAWLYTFKSTRSFCKVDGSATGAASSASGVTAGALVTLLFTAALLI